MLGSIPEERVKRSQVVRPANSAVRGRSIRAHGLRNFRPVVDSVNAEKMNKLLVLPVAPIQVRLPLLKRFVT